MTPLVNLQGPRGDYPLLFLIGYRGSGKTTTARLLALRLGWQWVDADDEIEAREGRCIIDIFLQEGEESFRAKEAAILGDLCERRQHVIATGGGVIRRPDNRAMLRQAGLVIWLTAEPALLWKRIRGDSFANERRPNLREGGQAEVEELLRQREALYRACADWIVATDHLTALEVVDAIMLQLVPRLS